MKVIDECQRIYIGGIQPPKLTVEMVLDRIRQCSVHLVQIDDRKIDHVSNFEDRRTYFFITAKSSSIKESSLDILSKLLHNVTWKGCTLQIQSAKPHFLERLAQERTKTLEPQSLSIVPETRTKIPRMLRIRKRYGTEAVLVDTKPILIKTPDRYSNKGSQQRPRWKTSLNRAIHLRYDVLEPTNDHLQSSYLKQPSLCTSKQNEYVESDTSLSFDSGNGAGSGASKRKKYQGSSSSSSSSIQVHTSTSTQDLFLAEKTTKRSRSAYVWSDEEEEEEDDIHTNQLDVTSTFNRSIDEIGTDRLLHLEQDVASNMRILSSLFPGTEFGENCHSSSINDTKQFPPQRSAVSNLGLMVRYDPKLSSSKAFLIDVEDEEDQLEHHEEMEHTIMEEDEVSESTCSTESCQLEDEDRLKNKSLDILDNAIAAETQSDSTTPSSIIHREDTNPLLHTYEQKQLENIFAMAHSTNKPMFNFCFDSLVVDSAKVVDEPETNESMVTPSNDEKTDHSVKSYIESKSALTQHRNPYPDEECRHLFLPQNILDTYTRQFYSLNGGVEQMKLDIENGDSNTKWDEERNVLTMDWKRKYKSAMARKLIKPFNYKKSHL